MRELLNGLRAAGESTRLRLLFLLAHGELTVKELTRILGQSQPRVSRHLKLLLEAGLLERHREGSWVFFRRADTGQTGALARMICDLIPASERAIARDLERLEAVRADRAEAAQAYFKANASQWNQIRSLHIDNREVEAALRQVFGPGKAELLIDLGTGTGRMLELFADRCGHGIGIDMNHEMLRLARANLDEAGCRHCQVRHGDILHLPYDNHSCDAVILHQVFHFLPDAGAALQEVARILKPGGRVLVADFAPHELEFLREQHAHRRLGISPAQMARWMSDAGLEIAAQRDLDAPSEAAGDSLTVTIWLARAPARAEAASPPQASKVEQLQ